jgi:hypothetical protein
VTTPKTIIDAATIAATTLLGGCTASGNTEPQSPQKIPEVFSRSAEVGYQLIEYEGCTTLITEL